MTSLNRCLILLPFLLCIVSGCATKPNTIIQTEYVEVKVPVRYKLTKPDRPVFSNKDTVPSYLSKVLTYTKQLEIIIDKNNRGE